jgi:hypothetical protein
MTDTRLLVPGWPLPVRRPVPGVAEAARRARRHDELECVRLGGQLAAMEQDIDAAQATMHRITEGLGLEHPATPPVVPLHGERVALRDGAVIAVRPVEPDDAPRLAEGFRHLSAVSRYRRFLGPSTISPSVNATSSHGSTTTTTRRWPPSTSRPATAWASPVMSATRTIGRSHTSPSRCSMRGSSAASGTHSPSVSPAAHARAQSIA